MKVQTRSIGALQEKRKCLTKAVTVVMFRMSQFIMFPTFLPATKS